MGEKPNTRGTTRDEPTRRERTVGMRKRFVAEYLANGRKGIAAAIAAGFSPNGAAARASRLLAEPEVEAMLAASEAKVMDKLGITTERVIAELAKIGFSDIRNVVSWGSREVSIGYSDDGKRLAPADFADAAVVRTEMAPYVDAVESSNLSPDAAAAVSEVRLTKDGLSIKMYDKRSALVDLGKYTGAFKDGVEVSIPVSFIVERTARSKDRA